MPSEYIKAQVIFFDKRRQCGVAVVLTESEPPEWYMFFWADARMPSGDVAHESQDSRFLSAEQPSRKPDGNDIIVFPAAKVSERHPLPWIDRWHLDDDWQTFQRTITQYDDR